MEPSKGIYSDPPLFPASSILPNHHKIRMQTLELLPLEYLLKNWVYKTHDESSPWYDKEKHLFVFAIRNPTITITPFSKQFSTASLHP